MHDDHMSWEGQERQLKSSQNSREQQPTEVTIISRHRPPFQRDLIYSVCPCMVLREVLIKGRKNFDTCEAEINI